MSCHLHPPSAGLFPCPHPGCENGRKNDRMRVTFEGELVAKYVRSEIAPGVWRWLECDDNWQALESEAQA